MPLLPLIFLLILPLTESLVVQKRQNIINVSVKYFKNTSSIHPVDVLNEKWETVAKHVNFNGTSSKAMKVIRLPENFEKVILKLRDEDIHQNEVVVSLRDENFSHFSIHTDFYKMKISTAKRTILKEVVLHTNNSNGCECLHGNCACCLAISVPEFRHSVCVNATYNPVSIGLDLSIGVDGHYFSEEISLRNPPPICFSLPIPGAEHVAGVCVAFTKLDLDKKAKILSGCMDFEVELVHLKLLSFRLGCFRMPI